MTVVSGIIFSPEEGALIADEQSSNQGRKYDIAQKLHDYSLEGSPVKAVMGGSGYADFLHAVNLRVEDRIKSKKPEEIPNGEAMANFIGGRTLAVKLDYLDNYLRTNLGLGWTDFKAGTFKDEDGQVRPIEPSLMENYRSLMAGGRDERLNFIHNNGFLLMTYEPSKVKLFTLSSTLTKPIQTPRPYESIGSGSDMADQVLYSFFENLPREKRNSVDSIEGLAALLHATERASAMNTGVGGIPYLTIIKDGELIKPSESNSKLAAEIVKADKKGLLKEGFYRPALGSLLYKGENFEDVEKEMYANAKDQPALNRMLRGYKA